ncbi:HAMP domain-containing sensor histidine kinase [Bradyrhizobium symbiodeficiens]|uniref:sensor histidine kinase n=1 Tax=Bradyrhizobium symbiodeficiens TaxID=1404367 RepID=UPI0030D1C0E5
MNKRFEASPNRYVAASNGVKYASRKFDKPGTPNLDSTHSLDSRISVEAARLGMARIMAVAGHDLKQPLQVAVMSIERAMLDGIETHTAKRLSLALDALFRLDVELSELAYSSQIATCLEPSVQPVDLTGVLDVIESDWAEYADSCGIELVVSRNPVAIRSDPTLLRTILRNLVGNAVKYSSRGSRVSVRCRATSQDVMIDISDEGRGISEVDLSRIFDAFQRGESVGKTTGLGLGLYIVRETASILRHPVTVRSIEGEGSTFWITIPRSID